jgi:sugar transferase (PEP-CTERM/EpsH1 system associated)
MSRDLERWLHDDIGVPSPRIRQIYNGVDAARYRPGGALPRDWPWLQHAREELWVCGTVGRLDPLKNQVALVDAFAGLVMQRRSAQRQLRLVIAGEGPARATIEARIRELGLEPLVWVAGARSDVPAVLAALDLFVLPSINEGISNTILEAMACGLPVVAARVGGNAELVEDGRTGTLCEGSAADPLAAAMRHYLADPQLGQRHGAAGRARVERHFSLEAMVRQYAALYDEVLARPVTGLQANGTGVQN